MANKKWTEEDAQELRTRVAAGETVPMIAAQMQRSQEATRARMQMMGLTKPRQFRAMRREDALVPELTEQ
jgi:hypothetical protein